jgi:hypothetical protein
MDESDPVDNYRDNYAHHAPTYLQKAVEDIRTLEVVYQADSENIDLPGSYAQVNIKKILIEEFGWRSNFREEDWRQEGPRICRRITSEALEE